MLDQFDKITDACSFISGRWAHPPKAAIILGSGLGAAAAALTDTVTIPYDEIPHFARSTAHGWLPPPSATIPRPMDGARRRPSSMP